MNKLERQNYDKEYYIKNKAKIAKRGKKWSMENKEKRNNINEKWSKDNPFFKIFSYIKSRCKERKIFLGFDRDSFVEWYKNKEKICEYCNISELDWQNNPMSKSKCYKILQIDRIIPVKGYTIDNVVFACPKCNQIKSNFFSYEQMLIIGKMIRENSKSVQYRS